MKKWLQFVKHMTKLSMGIRIPPEGAPRKSWVRICGPLPKILSLFMTQICDCPHPINDLTKNSILYLFRFLGAPVN